MSGGNHQLSLDEFFYCYRPQHIVSSKGTYHFAAQEKDLRLVSDMPDSNKNWKSRFFLSRGRIGCVVKKNGRQYRTIILTTLGLLSKIQVYPICSFSFVCLFQASNTAYSPCFLASICPHITEEQKDFIRRVIEIPLD